MPPRLAWCQYRNGAQPRQRFGPAAANGLERATVTLTVFHARRTLAILTALARDGRVAAAIALERALRGEAQTGDLLDDILRSKLALV